MCGRYTLTIDKSTIENRSGAKFYIAEPSYDWSPTFNAAPSQMLPIIRMCQKSCTLSKPANHFGLATSRQALR
jgi:putative SOS response-associated peptidase YedK